MSIIRVRKDEKYFTASNEPFVDKRLSWESRGLIGYLLTKPNNWEIRMEDLEKQGPAGNHKLRRMLAELRKAGYMNRIRVTLDKGKFDWVTELYESPSQNPRPQSSGRFSTSGSSTSGKVPDIGSTEEESTEETDSQIFQALEQLSGGLNTEVGRYVDKWKEKHSIFWILKAIEMTKAKKATSYKYTDSILIGWEANGYPKSREEKVKERRGENKETAPAPSSSRPMPKFDADGRVIV